MASETSRDAAAAAAAAAAAGRRVSSPSSTASGADGCTAALTAPTPAPAGWGGGALAGAGAVTRGSGALGGIAGRGLRVTPGPAMPPAAGMPADGAPRSTCSCDAVGAGAVDEGMLLLGGACASSRAGTTSVRASCSFLPPAPAACSSPCCCRRGRHFFRALLTRVPDSVLPLLLMGLRTALRLPMAGSSLARTSAAWGKAAWMGLADALLPGVSHQCAAFPTSIAAVVVCSSQSRLGSGLATASSERAALAHEGACMRPIHTDWVLDH
mmetsp:Transcript_14656/g.36515  ORF Transcript_14656/g.36515 Transcript_14656/m.36515 type:complete len:269 (-) Transcript_14656:359-1165(-)